MFLTPINVGRLNFTTTTAGRAFIMPFSGRLTAVLISDTTTHAGSDTDYHVITVVNKGQANAGTTAMVAVTNTSATVTGATGTITANIPASATLSATYANTLFVEGDVVLVTATRATSGAMTNGAVELLAVPGGY